MGKGTGITRRGAIKGAAAISAALAVPKGAAAQAERPSANRLWYRQPAKEWVEALPLGNGRLGCMVFGRTSQERLQLN